MNHDIVAQDVLMEALPYPAGAALPFLDRPFNMFPPHAVGTGLTRPVIRFPQDIRQQPEIGGDALGILHQPGTLFDHSGHGLDPHG